MPTEVTFAIVLVLGGFANQFYFMASNPLVQMSSNVRVRGRVMSIYVLVLLGGQALGGPLMGWIVERVGPHVGMLISGLVPALAAVVIALILAHRHQLSLSVIVRGNFASVAARRTRRRIRVRRARSVRVSARNTRRQARRG